jgi:hypothetical protein
LITKRTVSIEESRLEIRPIYYSIFFITNINWTLKGRLLSSTDKSSIHQLEAIWALELGRLDQARMEVVAEVTLSHQKVSGLKSTLLIKTQMLVRV